MSNLSKHEHADWCNYKHGRCECGAVDQKQPKEATTPEPREWLIRKRGYYYRPNRAGYTASVAEAGRYTKAEAENEAALEPWHMAAVHESAVSEPRLPSSKERSYRTALEHVRASAQTGTSDAGVVISYAALEHVRKALSDDPLPDETSAGQLRASEWAAENNAAVTDEWMRGWDACLVANRIPLATGSLLRPASTQAPPGCYCTDRCAAPVVMGRQTPCRDPEKAARFAQETSREWRCSCGAPVSSQGAVCGECGLDAPSRHAKHVLTNPDGSRTELHMLGDVLMPPSQIHDEKTSGGDDIARRPGDSGANTAPVISAPSVAGLSVVGADSSGKPSVKPTEACPTFDNTHHEEHKGKCMYCGAPMLSENGKKDPL